MRSVLVLRPSPGAEETAARAEAMGLHAVVAPLFAVRPLAWNAPHPGSVDAVMLTSANAPRHAGAALQSFAGLPCYAVGEATAGEAKRHGFTDIRTGDSDGAALAETMAREGIRNPLHLCGRDHIPLERPGLSIVRRIVYAAEALDALPPKAERALAGGAVALVHSPRSAATLAALTDAAGLDRSTIRVAAISPAAADAAGSGWRCREAAAAPSDDALLELAGKLCKTEPMGNRA